MRFLFGDVLPFILIGLFWATAFLWPHIGAGLSAVWVVFVTGGLIRSFVFLKAKVGNPAFLWCLFNVPTLVAGLIIWWRW